MGKGGGVKGWEGWEVGSTLERANGLFMNIYTSSLAHAIFLLDFCV